MDHSVLGLPLVLLQLLRNPPQRLVLGYGPQDPADKLLQNDCGLHQPLVRLHLCHPRHPLHRVEILPQGAISRSVHKLDLNLLLRKSPLVPRSLPIDLQRLPSKPQHPRHGLEMVVYRCWRSVERVLHHLQDQGLFHHHIRGG